MTAIITTKGLHHTLTIPHFPHLYSYTHPGLSAPCKHGHGHSSFHPLLHYSLCFSCVRYLSCVCIRTVIVNYMPLLALFQLAKSSRGYWMVHTTCLHDRRYQCWSNCTFLAQFLTTSLNGEGGPDRWSIPLVDFSTNFIPTVIVIWDEGIIHEEIKQGVW